MGKNTKVLLLSIALIVIVAAGIGGYYWWSKNNVVANPPDEMASWHTVEADGLSFKYPDLPTKYITPQSWPPQITASDGVFTCIEGGQNNSGQPGMTIQKTIGDNTYCIENTSEGTAGTFYTTYVYTVQLNDKLVAAQFTLGYVECGNFSDPQMTECENERQTFDLDLLMNKIIRTIQL
ncbi:MAG: hypothetical protein V1807_01605 [Patescibacteria group bacterium]